MKVKKKTRKIYKFIAINKSTICLRYIDSIANLSFEWFLPLKVLLSHTHIRNRRRIDNGLKWDEETSKLKIEENERKKKVVA